MMSGVGRLTVGGCQKLLMSSPRHLTSISPSSSHFTRQVSSIHTQFLLLSGFKHDPKFSVAIGCISSLSYPLLSSFFCIF
uniref:Uncharacterized protein n=1 Tax=Kalanchoe fedtschenkoi TaxID=63787 RepID=A0A7N0RD80_KALFE